MINQSIVSADGSTKRQPPTGQPNGGEVNISADSFLVDTGSRVTADGLAANAKGGEVQVDIADQFTIGQQSQLSANGGPTKRPFGSPDGGLVTVYSDNLLIEEGGLLAVNGGQRADGGQVDLWTFGDLAVNGSLEGRGGEGVDVQSGANIYLAVTGNLSIGPNGSIDAFGQDRGGIFVARVMGDVDIQGSINSTASTGAFQQNGGTAKVLAAGNVTISGTINVSGQENWVWEDGSRMPSGAYVNVKAESINISGAIYANGGSGGGQQYGGIVLLRASDHLAVSGIVHALAQESLAGRSEIRVGYLSSDFVGADFQPPALPMLHTPNPEFDEGDEFGYSVAIDGDWAVVGVPGDDDLGLNWGAVYLFQKDPWTKTWGHRQKVTCPPVQDFIFGRCGHAVDINGEWAAMGCPNSSKGTELGVGAVWVLRQSWQEKKWKCHEVIRAPARRPQGRFGHSLDLAAYPWSGIRMRLIVGEPTALQFGRAHIYRYRPDVPWYQWHIEGTFENPVASAGPDRFGHSVALVDGIPGMVLAYVGFPSWNDNRGIVFPYEYSAGVWSRSSAWLISRLMQTDASFGYSIATGVGESDTGDTKSCLAVGSPQWDLYVGEVPIPDVGLVELRCDSAYKAIHHPDKRASVMRWSEFGHSVALNNNFLAVGAPFQDVPHIPDEIDNVGAVYIFQYWTPIATDEWYHLHTEITPYWDNSGGDNFYGFSVGVSAMGDPYGNGNVDAIVGEHQWRAYPDAVIAGAVHFLVDL